MVTTFLMTDRMNLPRLLTLKKFLVFYRYRYLLPPPNKLFKISFWAIFLFKTKNQGPADARIKKCPRTMVIVHNLRPSNPGICVWKLVRLVVW